MSSTFEAILAIGFVLFWVVAFFYAARLDWAERKEKAKEQQKLLKQQEKEQVFEDQKKAKKVAEYQEKKEKYLKKVETDNVAFNEHRLLILKLFEKLDQNDKDIILELIQSSQSDMRDYDVVLSVYHILNEKIKTNNIEEWVDSLRRLENITKISIKNEGFIYKPIDGAFTVHVSTSIIIDKQLYFLAGF